MSEPLIICEDTREPPRAEHPWRAWSDRVVLVRRKLDEGDFGALPLGSRPDDDAAPLPVAVERKALGDFVACCTGERDRFVRCLERLARLDAAVVVVEATEADVAAHRYRSRATPQSVLASARAFAVDFRVPVWWAGSPERACMLSEWFLTRAARKAAREVQAA